MWLITIICSLLWVIPFNSTFFFFFAESKAFFYAQSLFFVQNPFVVLFILYTLLFFLSKLSFFWTGLLETACSYCSVGFCFRPYHCHYIWTVQERLYQLSSEKMLLSPDRSSPHEFGTVFSTVGLNYVRFFFVMMNTFSNPWDWRPVNPNSTLLQKSPLYCVGCQTWTTLTQDHGSLFARV